MKKKIVVGMIFIGLILLGYLGYVWNIIPHRKYRDEDFQIVTYESQIDQDEDGIEDQKDILENALKYISKKPKYKSKYYETGYPSDQYGVCTDVIAFALKDAGYDLMELVNQDILENRDKYDIQTVDKRIDFRRVENLFIYFERNAISLTTDIKDIRSWQAGDIVVFKGHIGLISNHRNQKGIPFVIHHANPFQIRYEEDILERDAQKIIGHFRIS